MSLNIAILGAGFIGRSFIGRALGEGHRLSVLDHNECPPEWRGRLGWMRGDLGEEQLLAQVLRGADTVLHLVSSTVPGDIIDEASELRQNVFQTLQVLHLCVQERVRQLVFLSSSSVYGLQEKLPIGEQASTDPISAHGIHKLTIEKYLQLYEHQHGLGCKIVRLSNPYGPGQKTMTRQGFVGIAIGRIRSGAALEIRGDGSHIRDFIHIDDVTEALQAVIASPTHHRTFNVGSGRGISLRAMIELFEELIGRRIPVEYTPGRAADIPASVLDISRIRTELSWSPRIELREGLQSTLAYHGVVVG